jgi:hemerythrin-like domain-containing protein
MSIGRRIDFDEPISQMIERLKSEHIMFESKLVEVEDNIQRNDIKQATQIVEDISDKIIRHAVEEEARLMRVIMHNAKDESSESIKIMQEHAWVINFLKNKVKSVKNKFPSSNEAEFKQIKADLSEFVNKLREHFKEEERSVFPLTLRADAAN